MIIVIAIVVTCFFYIFWRSTRQAEGSAFRAYDITFFTILAFYLLGRFVWMLQAPEIGEFSFRIWILPYLGGLDPFIFLYIPVVSYFIVSFYLHRNRLWGGHLDSIINFGQLGTILFFGISVAFGLIGELGVDWGRVVVQSLVLVFAIIAIWYFNNRGMMSKGLKVTILLVQLIGIELLNFTSDIEASSKTSVGIIYLLLFLITAGLILRARSIPKPQQPEFRSTNYANFKSSK